MNIYMALPEALFYEKQVVVNPSAADISLFISLCLYIVYRQIFQNRCPTHVEHLMWPTSEELNAFITVQIFFLLSSSVIFILVY